jgi:hypothetical protein
MYSSHPPPPHNFSLSDPRGSVPIHHSIVPQRDLQAYYNFLPKSVSNTRGPIVTLFWRATRVGEIKEKGD